MRFKIVKTTQIDQQNHNLQKCLRMLYYLYSIVIYIYIYIYTIKAVSLKLSVSSAASASCAVEDDNCDEETSLLPPEHDYAKNASPFNRPATQL